MLIASLNKLQINKTVEYSCYSQETHMPESDNYRHNNADTQPPKNKAYACVVIVKGRVRHVSLLSRRGEAVPNNQD
jgi:hypothetical protein